MNHNTYSIRSRKRGRKLDIRTNEEVTFVSSPINWNIVSLTQQQPQVEHRDLLQHHRHAVTIGHGCLLIPAIFLVWWYWTKRTARRVVHGVITFTHRGRSSSSSSSHAQFDTTTTICSGEDNVNVGPCFHGCAVHASSPESHHRNESSHDYRSCDDTLPNGSSSDSGSKFRFIDWMKQRTKTSRTKQTVRTTTLHNLHNSITKESGMNQIFTKATETLPRKNDDRNGFRNMESAPESNTHIQVPNNPTDTGIEMFVIEYPQQMTHSSNSISIM